MTKPPNFSWLTPTLATGSRIAGTGFRDDSGCWSEVTGYPRDHLDVELAHSLCLGCHRHFFPETTDRVAGTNEGAWVQNP